MKIVKNDIQDVTEEVNITYDPNKKYSWGPDDVFELTGNEFGLILNTLRQVLSTPEAQKILMADKANEAIEKAMAKGVEKGVVKEVTD
jgi:hypothetical protein